MTTHPEIGQVNRSDCPWAIQGSLASWSEVDLSVTDLPQLQPHTSVTFAIFCLVSPFLVLVSQHALSRGAETCVFVEHPVIPW